MSFTIVQNAETPFQAIKRRISEGRKIDIFSKGLFHGFGLKLAFFASKIITKHYFLWYFQEEQIKKNSNSLTRTMGLRHKMGFFRHKKLFCLQSKKQFFIYSIIKHYSWSYFHQKQIKKILNQNHGLTPLEKYNFLYFEKLLFCSLKFLYIFITSLNTIPRCNLGLFHCGPRFARHTQQMYVWVSNLRLVLKASGTSRDKRFTFYDPLFHEMVSVKVT